MLPTERLEIREYLDERGRSPYARWFNGLDAQAAAKVAVALARIEEGNLASFKSVGGGVLECKIDIGPGFRLYFGRNGARLMILLGGGTKKRQERDIAAARARWQNYRERKKRER